MSASSVGAAVGTFVLPGVGTMLGYTAGLQKEQMDEIKKARRSQEKLEEQRALELSREASARRAAVERAKTSGSRAGQGLRTMFKSGLGFGSGTSTPGLGAGSLFGN
jgi:hypothetical protein